MARLAGPVLGKNTLGEDIPCPFRDQTLNLPDGVWTELTDEEELISSWTEQHIIMGLCFPVHRSLPSPELKCLDCGSPWRYLHQMEYIYEGEYQHSYDAVCPKCQTRAAVTSEVLVQ